MKLRILICGLSSVLTLRGLEAVDLLFDFEGQAGPRVTDKLTEDGAQNGLMVQNVSIETEAVPFGDGAARFEAPDEEKPPDPPDPPKGGEQLFSTIEIPGTTELGSEWTIAAFVQFSNEGLTRLFSSFQGTGALEEDRVLLDFDPSGGQINFLRLIVGTEITEVLDAPNAFFEPGFHHIAVTFDSGEVVVYVDGAPLLMSLDFVNDTEIDGPVNLRFGEDPHDAGGTANEQFRGNVDDLLVMGRALPEDTIAEIAESGVEGQVEPVAGELAIFYDFEAPDTGTTITDRFDVDGRQDGIAHENVAIDPDVAHPLFGEQSAKLGDKQLFDTIEIPETMELGSEWTIAAFVNYTNTGFTRLFSSFQGTGGVEPNRLIFDMDPSGGQINLLRVIVGPDASMVDGIPAGLAEELRAPGYKHVALTFDFGEIAVYLNGELVPMTFTEFATQDSFAPVNLRFGEDPHDGGGTANEQFSGHVDDLLFTSRALSAAEIDEIAENGVAAANLQPGDDARSVWYDFESPDEGGAITDRLEADGTQNGIAHRGAAVVSGDADAARFGSGSAALGNADEPPPPPPEAPFNQIEIPETMQLGAEWTVATFVDFTDPDFTRLFSSYQGTGGVQPNRMILDIDPSGSAINGLRVIVGTTSDPFNIAQAISIPPELSEPGFKHFALTFREGEIHVYLNGVEVEMDSNQLTSTEAFSPVNLRFGEDPHDGGGTADEQLNGHVDDLLVIGRELSAEEIGEIADSGVEASGVRPKGDELAVWYDFEAPDSGTTITDRFTDDGSQDGIVHRDVRIDPEVAHPLFGEQSLVLGEGGPPAEEIPFSVIDVGPIGMAR